MINYYLNIYIWDIFLYILVIFVGFLPMFILNLEIFEDQINTFPDYYNSNLQDLNESIDELIDSWSDSAGADETSDSSSSLVFGGCFISCNLQGIITYAPLCINPCSDLNTMLIFCEDCVLGTIISLMPIIGGRTYAECINKDTPLIYIPIFVWCELIGQTMRLLSLSLRMSINVTAGHNLCFILISYIYMFITYSIRIKYQCIGILLIFMLTCLLCMDSLIAGVQSYVIIILETYYELDSE